MLASDFGRGLPVVQCKPDCNKFLKGNVAHDDRTAKRRWAGRGEGDGFDVNVGVSEWIGVRDGANEGRVELEDIVSENGEGESPSRGWCG